MPKATPIAALAAALLLAPAAAAQSELAVFDDHISVIGGMAGMAGVCAKAPATEATAALGWYKRMMALEDIALAYAARFRPDDKNLETAVMLALGAISSEWNKNPARIWDDPQGCGPAMRAEMDRFIAVCKADVLGRRCQAGLRYVLDAD